MREPMLPAILTRAILRLPIVLDGEKWRSVGC